MGKYKSINWHCPLAKNNIKIIRKKSKTVVKLLESCHSRVSSVVLYVNENVMPI